MRVKPSKVVMCIYPRNHSTGAIRVVPGRHWSRQNNDVVLLPHGEALRGTVQYLDCNNIHSYAAFVQYCTSLFGYTILEFFFFGASASSCSSQGDSLILDIMGFYPSAAGFEDYRPRGVLIGSVLQQQHVIKGAKGKPETILVFASNTKLRNGRPNTTSQKQTAVSLDMSVEQSSIQVLLSVLFICRAQQSTAGHSIWWKFKAEKTVIQFVMLV